MRRRSGFAATVVAALLTAFMISPASAYDVGSEPFDDARNDAVAATNKCSGLTSSKLLALMLSVTWPETTGNVGTSTPSPMTLSRSDNQAALYYGGSTSTPYQRAFWHPGIGVYQFDDSGLGTNYGEGKFNTDQSSQLMASSIRDRYCANSSLSYVFAPWFACGNGACTTIFNNIYNASTDVTRNLVRDASVTRYGGSAPRTCQFAGQSATFSCTKVNPNFAQGNNAWTTANYGPSPIAYPFYVFTQYTNGAFYEWRVWMNVDTGYGSRGIRRQYGVNSRAGMTSTTAIYMCDITANRCT